MSINLYQITNPLDVLPLIESNVFENCINLQEIRFVSRYDSNIKIRPSIYEIKDGAFQNCSKLKRVLFEDLNTTFNQLKNDNLNVPVKLADLLFDGCTSLIEVNIPNNIQKIGISTFKNCSSLPKIQLTNNIYELGEGSFQGCTKLSNINIPSSITEIKTSTFEDCSGLVSISLSDSITTIGNYAFKNCVKLETLNIPSALTSIKISSFQNCLNLKKLDLSSTIFAELQSLSLSLCSGLNEIWLYNTLQTIESNVFDNSFIIDNCALIVTNQLNNENIVYSYVKQNGITNAKLLFSDAYNTFMMLFNYTKYNLIKTEQQIRDIIYPILDILLYTNQSIVNINLLQDISSVYVSVNQNYNIILDTIRYKMFEFIFYYSYFYTGNNNISNFIISADKIKIRFYNIPDNDLISKNVKVYKSNVFNIDCYTDISNSIYGTFHMLDMTNSSHYSSFYINEYILEIYYSSIDNNYIIEYYTTTNTNKLTIASNMNERVYFSNFVIDFGYNYFTISYNPQYAQLNFQILKETGLILNSAKTLVYQGKPTVSMTANAYSDINVPVSTFKNSIFYKFNPDDESDIIADTISDTILYKVIYTEAWNNIIPTRADVQNFTAIPYPSDNKKINIDYLRYISFKIFNSGIGIKLFYNRRKSLQTLDASSNQLLVDSIKNISKICEDSGGAMLDSFDNTVNIGKQIFNQILYSQMSRLNMDTLVNLEWNPMPLFAGDTISFKLTINADPEQHLILDNLVVQPIPPRTYLVNMHLVTG